MYTEDLLNQRENTLTDSEKNQWSPERIKTKQNKTKNWNRE
jgi:hypothetical protein